MHSWGESIARATCVLPRAMRCKVARSSASVPSVRSYRRATSVSSDVPALSVWIASETRWAFWIRTAREYPPHVSPSSHLWDGLTLTDGAAQPLQKAGVGGYYVRAQPGGEDGQTKPDRVLCISRAR